MAGPIPAASGRIFISYRREETAYPAAWLFDRLADRFGGGQVFRTSTRSSWATIS
jgi:hypothetical protein